MAVARFKGEPLVRSSGLDSILSNAPSDGQDKNKI